MTEGRGPHKSPRTPKRPPVRALDVFLAFLFGGVLSWFIRLPLLQAFGDKGFYLLLVALFLPTVVLIAAIVWAFRTGRRAWGLGMTIYLGVGALVFGPFFAIWAMCAAGK
jgi:hypothetical protein